MKFTQKTPVRTQVAYLDYERQGSWQAPNLRRGGATGWQVGKQEITSNAKCKNQAEHMRA